MSQIPCNKLYKMLKDTCILDAFLDSCTRLSYSTSQSLEVLEKVINELLYRKEIFKKCRVMRKKYSKQCYGEIDHGHETQLHLLKDAEDKCNVDILKINNIIKNKENTLKDIKIKIKKLSTIK